MTRISANYSDLDGIGRGLSSTMDQHESAMDERLHHARASADFWDGQNNDDMMAQVMQHHKLDSEQILHGRVQSRNTFTAKDGYQQCVQSCSALFQ